MILRFHFYLRLYLHAFILPQNTIVRFHFALCYDFTISCYLKLQLHDFIWLQATSVRFHVTSSYTCTITSYLRLQPYDFTLPKAIINCTITYLRLQLYEFMLPQATIARLHLTSDYSCSSSCYLKLQLHDFILPQATAVWFHITSDYNCSISSYFQLQVQRPWRHESVPRGTVSPSKLLTIFLTPRPDCCPHCRTLKATSTMTSFSEVWCKGLATNTRLSDLSHG